MEKRIHIQYIFFFFFFFFSSFHFILHRFVFSIIMESMPHDIFTQNFHCKWFQHNCLNRIFCFISHEYCILFLFDSNILIRYVLNVWKYVRMVCFNRSCSMSRQHSNCSAWILICFVIQEISISWTSSSGHFSHRSFWDKKTKYYSHELRSPHEI